MSHRSDQLSRRGLFGLAAGASSTVALSACGGGAGTGGAGRKTLEMWFWGAGPDQRKVLEEQLAKAYNESQSEYELKITYNEKVDSNIQTALSANGGPDIVYGSGPSFVAPFAASGKLVAMDKYAEQYGWKDRILDPIYEAGTVDGKLYALPNSINTLGVFYNKKVLADLGVDVPTAIEELTAAMDAAEAKGLMQSVTGNKGWKPVNENYASLFIAHTAGPDKTYEALTGAAKWTDQPFVDAVATSAKWYEKGYLGGGRYLDLNFLESMQLLSEEQAPFFIGPTLAFQFASQFFTEDAGNVDDLGFTAFPNLADGLPSPLYVLATTASFSINAASKNQDACAAVIDRMMNLDFSRNMSAQWPGYWAAPLKELDLQPDQMSGLSKPFAEALGEATTAINEGSFGYFTATFFPPKTQQKLVDIESVWIGQKTPEAFMQEVEAEFAGELESRSVPPVPKP